MGALPLAEALRASLAITPRLEPEHKAVRDALAKLYFSDPKLANEVVTGACAWGDAIATEAIEALSFSAADQAGDLQDARALGISVSQHRINQLYAAEQAFIWLAEERYAAEREADEAYNERGGPVRERGWQRMFL